MLLTVSQLRKKLKGIDCKLPVYIADHDHGTYETNGRLSFVRVVNQADNEIERIEPQFIIKGKYLVLRVG